MAIRPWKQSIMEDHRSLSLPLLSIPDATFSAAAAAPTSRNESFFLSNYGIAVRLLSFVFIGSISLWANYEASKGFDITIVNDARGSPAGQRFDLFYVSNDKATRMVLNASKFVENLIYPSDEYPKKEVISVHLRLTHRNLSQSQIVTVEKLDSGSDFFINLSPSIFGEGNVNRVMSSAILRGMSRVWLWDGDSEAAAPLLAGLVEYISTAAGFGDFKDSGDVELTECDLTWWKNEDPTVVALFLDHHERCRKGFIQRLNQGLKSTWHHLTLENALGMPAQRPCGPFNYSGIR